MKPKEKAKELVDKYLKAPFNCRGCDMPFCDVKCTWLSDYEAKQCALIAVEQILGLPFEFESERKYWQEVKKELEKL